MLSLRQKDIFAHVNFPLTATGYFKPEPLGFRKT